MKITALGYVSLNVSDMSAWLDFVTKVFGMQVLPRDNGVVDLRIDEHHHRFTLQPAEQDSVAAIGWECASKEDIVALQTRLEQAGVATAVGSAQDCAERKVRDLVSFSDPFSDIRFELFHSPQSEAFPFLASKGIDGFKTGELGLGHVVYFVERYEESKQFYTDVLGFKISDYIVWDNNEKDATFLHCNPRHHSLAIMPPFDDIPVGAMGHIMLEAKSIDDVGRAYDYVREAKLPLMMEFGKHTNDHTQSFYVFSPSGFAFEYGYGGRLIDDNTWQVRSYDAPMLWGHGAPDPG